MALLEVQDLHVYYGNIEALRGISLHAEPGQIVAILGGNGAGKTTTLRTISGLLRPRSGSISCAGKSLVGVDAHVIVGMGVSHVPEGRRIFNILTVEENLALGGYSTALSISSSRRERRRCSPCSPGWPKGEASSQGRCPEANSRCWPS